MKNKNRKKLFVVNREDYLGLNIVTAGGFLKYPSVNPLEKIMNPKNEDTHPRNLNVRKLGHYMRGVSTVIITGGGDVCQSHDLNKTFVNIVMQCAVENAAKIIVVSEQSSYKFPLMDFIDEFIIYNRYNSQYKIEMAQKESKLNNKIRLVSGIGTNFDTLNLYMDATCPITFFPMFPHIDNTELSIWQESLKNKQNIQFRKKSEYEGGLFYLPDNSVHTLQSIQQLPLGEAGGNNESGTGSKGFTDCTGQCSD